MHRVTESDNSGPNIDQLDEVVVVMLGRDAQRGCLGWSTGRQWSRVVRSYNSGVHSG
jgi:hypothetical protein